MSRCNGDVIETFCCKEKEGQIKEEKECYDAIPINPTGFVKTENRVYTTKAKPIECNIHFPLKIQAKESWIQFTPRIIKIDPPKDFPEEVHLAHLDLTHGGIYTQEELEAWHRHLELGDVHAAISTSIAHGVCVGSQQCISTPGGDQPLYSLSALQILPSLQLSIWETISQKIRDCGTYISLVVIIIELIRFMSFISMFLQTLILDGIFAAKALLYLVLCSTHRQTKKVQRRRRRQKESKDLEMEMAPDETTRFHLGPDAVVAGV